MSGDEDWSDGEDSATEVDYIRPEHLLKIEIQEEDCEYEEGGAEEVRFAGGPRHPTFNAAFEVPRTRRPYPFTCEVCLKRFRNTAMLEQHKERHSATAMTIKKLEARCEYCQKTFCNKYYLKRHTEIHIRRKAGRKGRRKEGEVEGGVESLEALRAHSAPPEPTVADFKLNVSSGKIVCRFCMRVFKDEATLLTHGQTHPKDEPYECVVCGATHSQRSSLMQHLRTHAGSQLFACDTCGSQFTKRVNLKKHVLTHLNHSTNPVCLTLNV